MLNQIQRNLQLRIEEQGKQLKLMFDQQQQQQEAVNSVLKSNDKHPDDPSSSCPEHAQFSIAQGSENSQFPSKIS